MTVRLTAQSDVLFLPVMLGLALLAVALSLLLVPASIVRADTHIVTSVNDSGPDSLRQIIADAAAGDTINFNLTYPATITLTSGQLEITKSLTISGPGADKLAISGNNASCVFRITGGGMVTMTDMTIRDGKASMGGGIYNDNAILTLSKTVVISNIATGGGISGGGGIYVNSGNTILDETQISSNSAPNGGGIFIQSGGVTFQSGQIGHNFADGSSGGGGMYIEQGRALLNGGQIISNTAVHGGGIYISRGQAILDGGQVINNFASDYGGGVFVDWAEAVFTQTGVSTIAHNSARDGGGVYLFQGRAVLSGGQITDNSSSSDGGGVYSHAGNVVLNGGLVISNSASQNGGGVYVYRNNMILNEGQIVSNSASTDGGGIYVMVGDVTGNGGQISRNSASGYGGGIYIFAGRVILSSTNVLSNFAAEGGGFYIRSFSNDTVSFTGTLTATNGCIVNNTDTAVYRLTSTVIITDTWWGTANGPSGAGPGDGDSVGPDVTYFPFKTETPDGCPSRLSWSKLYLPVILKGS